MMAGTTLTPVSQHHIPSAKTVPGSEAVIIKLKILIPLALTVKPLRSNLKPSLKKI